MGCVARMMKFQYAIFAAVLFSALMFFVVSGPAFAQQTFTVNDAGDGGDAGTSDAVCETTGGSCTLRAAIEQANSTAGDDTIEFDLAGDGPHTISPASLLPEISESLTIDGYTQSGAAPATANEEAALTVEIDGTEAGEEASGLILGSGASSIRGLAVGGFSGYGIRVLSDGNVIEGSHIGTNVAGDEKASNGVAGVIVENSSGNTIGGEEAADRNVVSGNGLHGVWVFGTFGEAGSASGNVISGNYLGTDSTGEGRLENGNAGVGFGGGGSGVQMTNASGNTVGGVQAGERNIISGNGRFGVNIVNVSSNNKVLGNYVGTDVSGTVAITNEQDGVRIENRNANPLAKSSGNVIGGTRAGARNVISGNNSVTGAIGTPNSGVVVRGPGTGENEILGNYIGPDESGKAELTDKEMRGAGNGRFGVWILQSSGNVIGGAEEGAGNVISGNLPRAFDSTVGVEIEDPTGAGLATENVVQGNFIGTDSSGTRILGNIQGVRIEDAPGNLIGGTGAGEGNVISGNVGDGVRIFGVSATGNRVKGNLIGTNASGDAVLSNARSGGSGVSVAAPGNIVGGTEAGAGNVISGNGRILSNGELIGFGVALNVPSGSEPADFGGSVIQGNLIGTDITGAEDLGNFNCAVIVTNSPDNLIGGAEAGAGNVISGSVRTGLQIDSPAASGNRVLGNFIGTDISGGDALGNAGSGVVVSGAPDNIVGAPGAGNVISDSKSGHGIVIQNEAATGNSVQANLVGTDESGTKDFGNGLSGIAVIGASANEIGGAGEGEGNVLSGNGFDGIVIASSASSGNVVLGNLIGTDATGENAIPNGNAGVVLTNAPDNTIGGVEAGAGNVISGNAEDGVYIVGADAEGNDLIGNFIGTGADGTSDLGNVRDGVRFTEEAGGNATGGASAASENVIAFNGGRGVLLRGTAGGGNAILRNSIFANGDLGIDLGEDGVTPNDAGDADSGPNALQNFPVIAEASTFGGETRISGSFSGAPNGEFTLRFYASPEPDASGYGEGEKFIGQRVVSTNAEGRASLDLSLPVSTTPATFISATATSSTADTSEFSEAVEIAAGEKPPPEEPPSTPNPNACTITGTSGNDVLRGTAGRDVICGLGGNDIIYGLGGNDILRGGAGNDTIYGGNGADRIEGGAGNDALYGERGNDTIFGGRGNDVLRGGPGQDRLNGGSGKNSVKQ